MKASSIYAIIIGVISSGTVLAWAASINKPVSVGEALVALILCAIGVSGLIIGGYDISHD